MTACDCGTNGFVPGRRVGRGSALTRRSPRSTLAGEALYDGASMHRTTIWLWLALGGAILQFVSLGTDFYVYEGNRQTAWFGVPHTRS